MRNQSSCFTPAHSRFRFSLSSVGITILASLALGADCDPPNLNTIEVSGATGTTTLTSSDLTSAYAWTADQLTPPHGDRPGSTQSITWTPGFKNFELIAFDWRYDPASSNMGVAGAGYPMIGEHTGKHAAFASLRNGGSMQFRLDHPIAHFIQYWHGQCSIRMKWSDVFDYISTQLMGAYSCALKNAEESVPILGGLASATREYEFYEPHFSSRGRFMEWGFAFHGKLRTHFAGIPTATVELNPAFVLSRIRALGKSTFETFSTKSLWSMIRPSTIFSV